MISQKTYYKIKKGIIPAILFGDIKKSSNIFLHLNISNGNKEISKFFKIPNLKKSCFLIVDLPGHGECKIKVSRRTSYFVDIIKNLIELIKKQNKNIKKVFLVGESFGANLAILLTKKYSSLVQNVIAINPPLKLKNPKKSIDEKGADNTFKLTCKFIFTLLTNINTYSIPKGINQLTDNQIFIRVWKMYSNKQKQDTKVNLAAWFSMHKTRHYLKKHFKENLLPTITLIDSKEEFYYDKNKNTISILQKTKSSNNVIRLLEYGTHILSIDTKYSDTIWNELVKLDK